jgi:hypothetical protein
MAGRKPLPLAIKQIKGTVQKCRTNPHEPRPTSRRCASHVTTERRRARPQVGADHSSLGVGGLNLYRRRPAMRAPAKIFARAK